MKTPAVHVSPTTPDLVTATSFARFLGVSGRIAVKHITSFEKTGLKPYAFLDLTLNL